MKENEEIECLDLNALYNALLARIVKGDMTEDDYGYHVYTHFGHAIRREPAPDGSDYFDLYKNAGSCLKFCCDGEECKVLEKTDEYVKLIDIENIDNEELDEIDTTFRLSLEEFRIATGIR